MARAGGKEGEGREGRGEKANLDQLLADLLQLPFGDLKDKLVVHLQQHSCFEIGATLRGDLASWTHAERRKHKQEAKGKGTPDRLAGTCAR